MAHKNNKKQKDEETPVCADCRRVAVLEPGALCVNCQKKRVLAAWGKK
jgi:hypothetical protein